MKLKCNLGLVVIAVLLSVAGARAEQAQPTTATPQPGQFKVPYYGKFSELSVGAVQPRGWLQKWLERQAQGLTGHPENLAYPYDTCMYAGLIPPPVMTNKWWSSWWPYEQSAYFVDATTRLSWLIHDDAISRRRDANMDFILGHSSGTNLGGSHTCWPNAVVGRALMAEFSATGDPRVTATLQDWLLTSADDIAKGGRSGVNFEEAFYLYGLTGDPRLLQLCRRIYDGYLQSTNSFFTTRKIHGRAPFHEHGVTAAEELKCLPLMYAYTGDQSALHLAERAYKKVIDNNLMADGGMVSEEHLAPAEFYSVHESCDITDWSWSLGYMFMASGEPRYADLVERATFNALPGAVTKDFKQLQYFSPVNQVVVGPTNGILQQHWATRMTYRAAHDTECCSGNINRAMPNYVIRMWMRTPDAGLAAVYYGPSEVTTTVGGHKVTITEETDYPFRDTITFRIKTAEPVTFNLQCRIPEWCVNAGVRVNGQAVGAAPKPETFATVQREFRDSDTVQLTLPMPVRTEKWFKGRGVSITRGPLVFSLKLGEQRVEHTQDAPEIKPFLAGREIRGFPEVEFLPTSDWRYGLDAGRLDELAKIKVVESGMTDNPFLAGQTPVRLEVPVRRLPEWSPAAKDRPALVPQEPKGLPSADQLKVEEVAVPMTFVPYGATYLRLTTLPVLQ